MKQTIFHDTHVSLGARMAPFGGYEMPIQYKGGIIHEHELTRKGAALFDTCHMGEFDVRGPGATEALEALVSCPVASMNVGQCRYGLLCNPEGGVIDDLLVYRLEQEAYMLVVNAGTQDDDFAWVTDHLPAAVAARNISDETAKIDLQGPGSPAIMARLMDQPIDTMRFYRWAHNAFKGRPVLVSRTGYTGEIGFEVYADSATALEFWQCATEEGAEAAGLGARDTLRLEMGMPLYGHELSATRNAAETGFKFPIARDKTFIGSDTVCVPGAARQLLTGLRLEGRRAAREGDRVVSLEGNAIGTVTSGSFGPSVGHAVALAYVDVEGRSDGTRVRVQTQRQELEATVSPLPFYAEGTARQELTQFLGETQA